MVLLAVLGLIAGVLTTLTGMGGGLFLVAVLSALRGPHLALALSSPALFVSNSHRAFLYRSQIDRRIVALVAAGAVPGALIGGLLLKAIPAGVVTGLLLLTTLFAVLRHRGLIDFRPKGRSLVGAGAGVGALSATSAGAGMLLGPVLMAAGLSGVAFVATIAACAVAMHLGRVAGYLASGLLTTDALPAVGALLVGLLAGNLVGRRMRDWVPKQIEPKVELVALVASTALALVGLGR